MLRHLLAHYSSGPTSPSQQISEYSADQQGACHTVALPFTLKSMYLKAKEKLWKLKYFAMQKIIFKKIL